MVQLRREADLWQVCLLGAAARKILVHYHLDAACCKPHALFHLWSNCTFPSEPREVRPEWAFWDASCNVRVLGVHLGLSFTHWEKL